MASKVVLSVHFKLQFLFKYHNTYVTKFTFFISS